MKKEEQIPVETKPDTPETKRVPFETTLKVKLNDAETLAYAREMAEVSANVTELEDEMKSLAAEYKGKIAIKEARRDVLGKYIATGFEHRPVKCERVFDYDLMLVSEVRTDGQDPYVINQRVLTQDELQRQLNFPV